MGQVYFKVGGGIRWKQFPTKESALHTVRTGRVWSDAPRFEGESGAFVWVIPDAPFPKEKSAIAVRVHKSGARRGDAEVYETSPSYSAYSLKE